ncbi:MAG TPA: FAD-binding protein [Steroidobacteraceae bacterium]|nr:FAD-binding protein [Steroidobacteraceae bacterium]
MLCPRDEADLAEIVASASGPLEPLAGGSLRSVGKPLAGEVLDLSSLAGIVQYEPDELVLSARAATPLEKIERVLGEHGQRLGFEPPDWGPLLGATGRPTLGGVLAANASGSRRVAAGAARDHFLGFRAVSGRGERFKGGGRVFKNVTGYDLPKLLAGSWGTLAVLTEVTVRLTPTAEHERTLLVPARDPATAVRTMTEALGSPCEVSAAAFVPRRGVALRLEGFAASVSARAQALLEQLGRPEVGALEDAESRELWRAVGAVRPLASHPIVWRLSVPPSDAARLIERLAPDDYVLDWGGGLIWMGCAQADAARVRGALASGHALLVKAPPAVRAAIPVFQPLSAPLTAVMARLKTVFDPAARLNPGRMS